MTKASVTPTPSPVSLFVPIMTVLALQRHGETHVPLPSDWPVFDA